MGRERKKFKKLKKMSDHAKFTVILKQLETSTDPLIIIINDVARDLQR